MTNKTILVALLLVTTASVVGVASYYATDLLRDETKIVAQPEAPGAQTPSGGAQDAPPGTVDLDELLAEEQATEEPAAEDLAAKAPAREERVADEPAEEAGVQAALPQEEGAAGVVDEPEGPPSVAPRFDVVRVEPSGEFIAAGRSAPNARVEMLLGSEILASETANNVGEWTMVPDEPLPAGRHDLMVRAISEAEGVVNGDRVAVVIEEAGSRPLVAVTRSGEATEIVQRPEEIALAEPREDGADEPRTDTDDAVLDTEIGAAFQAEQNDTALPTSEPSEPMSSQAPSEGVSRAPSVSDGSQTRDESTEAPRTVVGATEEAGVETDEGETRTAQGEPAREESLAALPGPDEAARRVEEDADIPPVTNASLAIDAVEVEGSDRLYLSGHSAPDADIRLYVNQEHLGDVRAGADGTWSRIGEWQLPPGRYTIRADVVDAQGNVEERAEVSFDRVRLATAEGTQTGAETPAGLPAAPDAEDEELALRVPPVAGDADTLGTDSSDQAEVSPTTVYIERGDNLWHIARQVYGEGVRYTVIYEANQNQIRDPDLIFPGQVFTIPLPDESGD